MNKIKLFLDLFRQGRELSDKEVWQDRTKMTNIIIGVLGTVILLLQAFGIDLGVTGEDLSIIGTGIAGLVLAGNAVMRVVANKDKGLPAKPEAVDRET